MRKKLVITDFLTKAQIKQAMRYETAREICEHVITPNINEINMKLCQVNDPMFLAYAVEYILSQARKDPCQE